MSLVLTDNQEVSLSVTPVSKGGNEAPVESKTTGKVGSAQVKFSCDARIGDGISPLLSTLDVEVVPGEAVNVKIDAATPSEKA